MNLFKKLINKMFSKSNSETEILHGIDIEEIYNSPDASKNLKVKIQEAIDKKEQFKLKYEEIISKITFIQKVDDLPKEELKELEKVAKHLSETLLEKETSQSLLKSHDSNINYLEKYKEEIEKAIKLIEEHENDLSIIKNDLSHLEGEKAEISYQTNRIKKALTFVKTILLITIFAGALTTLILSTMLFVYDFDIFLPSLITVIVVFALGLWIFTFRRYLIHESKKFQLLQKREIELTNKTKIKYVNVQQFLDFEYKKYQVNSSEMLKIRWDNYQSYTKNEAKFKTISNNISSLIQDLDRILMRNNFDNEKEIKFAEERIDYFISKKERKKLINTLNKERDELKLEYDKCENEIRVLSNLQW